MSTHPKLALSMIVRNAAGTLRDCLDSVRGVVDEIAIADTGSTDETIAIAREYGARVIEFPWENDFAKARNLSLAQVQADWVLFLDADEMLDPSAAAQMPSLLAGGGSGYNATIRNYLLSLDLTLWDRPAKPNDSTLPQAKAFPAYAEHENVRLFRRDPRIFFIGRVHESVGPAIEQAGLHLGNEKFLIHHFGLAVPAKRHSEKTQFYRELGKQKVLEMPDDAQAHLELGMAELENNGDPAQALASFQRAYELNPQYGVAWFFAGSAHCHLGHYEDALRCFKQAEKHGHATALVAEGAGDAFYGLHEFSRAIKAYKRALGIAPNLLSSQSKLGLAMVRGGFADEGLRLIRAALAQKPAMDKIHDRLVMALTWSGRVGEAATAAEDKLRSVARPKPADFIRAATLWTKSGDWKRATAVLHVGLQVYPNEEGLRAALGDLSAHGGSQVDTLLQVLGSNR